ncbi:peptidoglycan-binding protein [Nonomuraea typhae]|uniref:Peptidoglycan-binding protein n=1 Tax=Nonomuraea typhae TaxID=2603600 RepID=A0ABW7YN77_9ACTN
MTYRFTADDLLKVAAKYEGYNEADNGGKTKFGIWYGDRAGNSAFDRAAWCFAAGTLVTTWNGLRPIEDIQCGDVILTGQREEAKVSTTLSRDRELVRVVAFGPSEATMTTEDHPFRARRGKHGQAEWIAAGELQRGDMVAVPIPQGGDVSMPTDLAYLVGLYLAEGNRSKSNRVRFSLNRAARAHVVAVADRAGLKVYSGEGRTCSWVEVNDLELYELCGLFGDGAENKEIHQDVMSWSTAARKALLDGYLFGDGHKVTNAKARYGAVTVSRKLAQSLATLLLSVGLVASVRKLRDAGTSSIEGREVNTKRTYITEWSAEQVERPQWYMADGFLWVPVRSVERTGETAKVYDIRVDHDSHSFIADGLVVHNCDMFVAYCSWESGGERGLDIVGEYAFTPHHASWFARNGRWGSTPTRGAIGFIDWNGSKRISAIDHVVIVKGTDSKGRIVTIEGNTDDQVAERRRARNLFVGFGYPRYVKGTSVKVPTTGGDDKPTKPVGRPAMGSTAPKFPLPSGSWFSTKSHNGTSNTKDRDGIRRFQARLKERSWGITADGIFGPRTDQVVRAFQDEHRLKVDGCVGKITWAAIWQAPVTP